MFRPYSYGLGWDAGMKSGLGGIWHFFEWTSDLRDVPFQMTSTVTQDPTYPGEGPKELRGGGSNILGDYRIQSMDIASRYGPETMTRVRNGLGPIEFGAIRCARFAREGETR